MKQARSMMITAITRDLENRFDDMTGEKTYIDVAHTDNDEMAQELAAELRELFPETEAPYSTLPYLPSDRPQYRSRQLLILYPCFSLISSCLSVQIFLYNRYHFKYLR